MIDSKSIEDTLFSLAKKAFHNGEIPISSLITCNGKIIAKSYNLRERKNDITAHTEILSIRKAAKKLKRWNLSDCELYVTLKPCKMCEEVIKQSRIKKVYYMLERLDYKHDFSKTCMSSMHCTSRTSSYQQLLTDFFQNMRE